MNDQTMKSYLSKPISITAFTAKRWNLLWTQKTYKIPHLTLVFEFLMTFHLQCSATMASKAQRMLRTVLCYWTNIEEHECNQTRSWGRRYLPKFQFYSCHLSPPSSSEKSTEPREVKANEKCQTELWLAGALISWFGQVCPVHPAGS